MAGKVETKESKAIREVMKSMTAAADAAKKKMTAGDTKAARVAIKLENDLVVLERIAKRFESNGYID